MYIPNYEGSCAVDTCDWGVNDTIIGVLTDFLENTVWTECLVLQGLLGVGNAITLGSFVWGLEGKTLDRVVLFLLSWLGKGGAMASREALSQLPDTKADSLALKLLIIHQEKQMFSISLTHSIHLWVRVLGTCSYRMSFSTLIRLSHTSQYSTARVFCLSIPTPALLCLLQRNIRL